MPYLSSCNIACGGHAGSHPTMRLAIKCARKYGVAIGAHPSYPDKKFFGRKVMNISDADLRTSLQDQIRLLKQICKEEGVPLHHVKLHGALYHQVANDRKKATLISEILSETAPTCYWMGMADTECEEAAKAHNLPFIREGFADRQYEPDGTLRSRNLDGAVLPKQSALKQAEELALQGRVMAGVWIPVSVQSICIHSDTKEAITLAKEIRQHLENKEIRITAIQ